MKSLLLLPFLITPVLANAQANCNAAATGFTPINDLGTGISPVTGKMGGLYPSGSNSVPAGHLTAGLQMAAQIQCLDTAGTPEAVNGKMVWLSIGMSNCTQETQQFIPLANAFSGKNPRLTLVDGALGGHNASIISTPGTGNYTNFWNNVQTRLANAGVSAKQVQVVWFKEANVAGTTPIQVYHDSLVVQIKRIMNELKIRFPNVKLCYLASRSSARYASTTLNPEPYAYWTGWAVKKVIEDQINGDAQLAYSGTAKAPWLSWGIYMWSDGSTPQTTNPNVFYNCPGDFANDGTHPSTAGAQKIGGLLVNFFSTDSTAKTWFLGTGCPMGVGLIDEAAQKTARVYPNPSFGQLEIQADFKIQRVEIFNAMGKIIGTVSPSSNELGAAIILSGHPVGLYVLKISDGTTIYQRRIVLMN